MNMMNLFKNLFKRKTEKKVDIKRQYLVKKHDYSMIGRRIEYMENGIPGEGIVLEDKILDNQRQYTVISELGRSRRKNVPDSYVYRVDGIAGDVNKVFTNSDNIVKDINEFCSDSCFCDCSDECILFKYKIVK